MSDRGDAAQAGAARQLAAAFVAALARARQRVDRPALVAAIARGDRFGAQAILVAALGAEGLAGLEAAWGHAAGDAGRLAADEAPDLAVRKGALPAGRYPGLPDAWPREGNRTLRGIPAAFSRPPPATSRRVSAFHAAAAATEYTGMWTVDKRLTFNPFRTASLSLWASQLRLSLEAYARRAIAAALDRWMGRAEPERVADAAIAAIGLTERDVLAVANYRGFLENLDRAALRSQLRDARHDPRILRAIREQQPLAPDYVDMLVAKKVAYLEASRAALIGRTEALRARWTGTLAAWQQQVDTGLLAPSGVRVLWVHRHDDRVRHAHREIPVINPVGVVLGQAFQSPLGPIRYPGDPAAAIANVANCRCTLDVRVRSEARAA